jgi:hypothetical protein
MSAKQESGRTLSCGDALRIADDRRGSFVG